MRHAYARWRAARQDPERPTMRTMELLDSCARAAFVVLLAAAASAQPPSKPAAVFANVLPELKQKTQLPVLLPGRLPSLLAKTVFATAETGAGAYTIRLESEPDCKGSEVCYVGTLTAVKGGAFSFPETVQISQGLQGRFRPASCAGTCTPPAIEWKVNGVLYTAQLTLKARNDRDQRSALIQLADSASLAGPR